MKSKKWSCLLIGAMVLSLVACGSDTEEVAETISEEMVSEETTSEETSTDESVAEIVEGEVTVIGKVVSVAGNMVTIQVGSYIEQEGMSEGGAMPGMMEGMEGELPEGVEEGELPEGVEEGELPEGMEEGMSEREIPEGVEEGELPEGMEEGMSERELPEGVEEGELPEGIEEGEMPEGMEEGMTGGMMPGMMEGTEGGIEAVDMSEFIELTDETVQITIPVGVAVYSMGIEYDFTDIVEDCYITISENDEGTIVAVNILG